MLAAGAAPAIVKADNIMRIFVPKRDIILYGDGRDDSDALQAFFDGKTVLRPDGTRVMDTLEGGTFFVSKTIDISRSQYRTFRNSTIHFTSSPLFYASSAPEGLVITQNFFHHHA